VELYRSGAPQVLDWQDWLIKNLAQGARIGINGNLFSIDQYRSLEKALAQAGLKLISLDQDPIDLVWGRDRPKLPPTPVRIHPQTFAGETVQDKLDRLRQRFKAEKVQGLLVTALDEIAWLLNLRGSDVEFNPVFYAYLWVGETQVKVFTDISKVSEDIRTQLGSQFLWAPYHDFMDFLTTLPQNQPLWVDPSTANAAIARTLSAHGLPMHEQPSPIPGWKSVKNDAELNGMVKAHRQDGVALVKFLRWIKEHPHVDQLDEISVEVKLEEFRKQSPDYIGPSFATIAGFGPNGALPHYRATRETNLKLKSPGILLLDSGGQYIHGTTDITRTLVLYGAGGGKTIPQGESLVHPKKIYTLVLKGHLQLARSQFPAGTLGLQLDAIARQPLWQHGLTYGHGTGHGVGAALCVHEGPFSLSTRKNFHPIQVGNVLSNEPACYFEGDFGVRIENLVTVTNRASSGTVPFLGFDDLTLCPYDRDLIDLELLQKDEISQVDRYHERVVSELSGLLKDQDLDFLKKVCRPLQSLDFHGKKTLLPL
jgi:Xaa-Pro aminopeptidase